MHINHRYLLWKSKQLPASAQVLDYGCGAAETVEHGLKLGLNIFGADVFYAGGDRKAFVEQKGLMGHAVRVIEGGRAPFPDGHFDFIISNYVLEHVEDLDAVLDDVARLLKPGGRYLALFPSRDVWREGHCGIPFLHRFSEQSRLRLRYALTMRRLGAGHHKGDKTPLQWTTDFLDYLDRYTHYRDRETIFTSFRRHFDISLIEHDYIEYRICDSRFSMLSRLMRLPLAKPAGSELFRRLAGLHLLARRPEAGTALGVDEPSATNW